MGSIGCPNGGTGSGGLGPLRELLASLPACLAYVAGPDMVFEFASDGYCQALGGRDLIARPFREALPDLVGQLPFEALCKAMQTGERYQVRGEEVRLRRPGAEAE